MEPLPGWVVEEAFAHDLVAVPCKHFTGRLPLVHQTATARWTTCCQMRATSRILARYLQECDMKKSVAALSPIVPGKYFVFVERVVREQYQTQTVNADSEDAARDQAFETFFAGSVAYMTCTQVEPPVARVRPMREKNLRRSELDGKAPQEALDFRTAARFMGDGAHTVEPASAFPGTHPMTVTKAQARLLCRNFDACGHSNHSGQGSTLWVILEHCAAANIPYNLHVLPGMGYYLERSRAIADGLALRMSVETEHGALGD
jgi:hypothetical protein